MSKKKKVNVTAKKDFEVVPILLRPALRLMFKRYGLEQTFNYIDGMSTPSDNEKSLMKEYVNNLVKNN